MITSFYSQVLQFEQAAGREYQIKRDQELALPASTARWASLTYNEQQQSSWNRDQQ